MYKVYVMLPARQEHRERLAAAAKNCEIIYSEKLSREQIADADIIIGNPSPGKIKASPKLKLLQLFSAGADPYLPEGVLNENTVLTNATGAYSKAVSEHGFAQTLMLQKKLHLYRDAQLRGEWADEGTVTSMADATVVVVGLGDIGRHYAKMAKALGAYVIGVKRRSGECPEYVDELWLTEKVDEVLPRADVVFSVLPGTADTNHFYTLERFALMKPSALFINCGRGSAVSAETLERALNEKLIAAAAVDVTEVEPLPADSPLWKIPNLLITPHVAGGMRLELTRRACIEMAQDNLRRYLAGEPLRNRVL